MATEKTPVSIDSLTSDERKLVVSSLELKKASVKRAANSETDDLVHERRMQTVAAIDALINRFR